jgi:hypothetical protein
MPRVVTHHSHGPENAVVYQQPRLLGEARKVLASLDALPFGEWRQDVLHGARTQPCEQDNEEGDEVGIIGTGGIFARSRIVVAEGEELARMYPSPRNEEVGKEKQCQEVERQA